MKTIRKTFTFLLSPIIFAVAVVLFVLDNFNVNVSPLVSYISKEVSKS